MARPLHAEALEQHHSLVNAAVVALRNTRANAIENAGLNLSSTHFCLANPGKQYLTYLPEGDTVTLDMSGARGMLECEWMDPTAGTITAGGTVEGGGRRIFPSPLIGPSALYVWQS